MLQLVSQWAWHLGYLCSLATAGLPNNDAAVAASDLLYQSRSGWEDGEGPALCLQASRHWGRRGRGGHGAGSNLSQCTWALDHKQVLLMLAKGGGAMSVILLSKINTCMTKLIDIKRNSNRCPLSCSSCHCHYAAYFPSYGIHGYTASYYNSSTL